MPASNHAWNAVYLPEQGGWALLDSTWCAGHVNGARYEREYKDVYFLTRPDLFIINHLASAPKWTLLNCPPSWMEFRETLGSLTQGWRPSTCPRRNVRCSASSSYPTSYSFGFETITGCPIELDNVRLISITRPEFQESCMSVTSGTSEKRVRDIVRGTAACDFKLRGRVKVYKDRACSRTFYPDDLEYVITAFR